MRIIIDGNAMGWAFHSSPVLNYAAMQTQAIFGFVKMLRDVRVSNPGAQIIVLWDGHAKFRFDMLPEYKESRQKRREEDQLAKEQHEHYKKAVPVIRKAVELMGITQLLHPDFEADDLAGVLCSIPGRKRLQTGDSDWWQLVDAETDWEDPRAAGKLIKLANFHESTGYATPREYIQGKALMGDGTDDIPGVDGLGPKKASEFMAKHRTVEAFYEKVDSGQYVPAKRKSKTAKSPHEEEVIASAEGRAMFARNMQLMSLTDTPALKNLQGIQVLSTPANGDADKVQLLFQRLGFVSLLRDFNNWIACFHLPKAATAAQA